MKLYYKLYSCHSVSQWVTFPVIPVAVASAAFLSLSAGVSVHTDWSPSSACVERNFLGPKPKYKKSQWCRTHTNSKAIALEICDVESYIV